MDREQPPVDFDGFRERHAAAVFALALRHSGDDATARECVDVVFAQLADHWFYVRDPLRFTRRAAVLFVCHGRRRTGQHPAQAHRSVRRPAVPTRTRLSAAPTRTPK